MPTKVDASFDALVIGAGFSGLYTLHRLRQQGIRTRVLEMAESLGGTWLYNRYPGARCDIESIEYSYSFSDEIQQEWVWTETMPAQPEIEAYLNFVADRLDLRCDIQFDTKVVAMDFDDEAAAWVVRTEAGETFRAPFVVAATGILSAPLEPDIPGMATFAGTSLFTSRWPNKSVDLAGKRVGVIGTGSCGLDQRLHRVLARQRNSHHRGATHCAAGVDRPRHLARGGDGAGPPVVQLLVQRRQCAGQETDVHGLYRRNPRIPTPLRRNRGWRIHRF
jgi:cation diffusion facilitator CzcD-associated flavoprotein CzcO